MPATKKAFIELIIIGCRGSDDYDDSDVDDSDDGDHDNDDGGRNDDHG